jgi:hypothetical protein
MNDDPEFKRATRDLMELGSDRTPDTTIDAVLLAVRTTPQERDLRIPWRNAPMSNPMRLVAAIAIIVVVGVAALIGINLGRGNAGVGAPAAPTPSPTPAPTLPAGQIPSGTYRAGFLTYALPAGWTAGDASGSVTVFKPNANPPKGMAVDQWQGIATVYSDPCRWQTTGASVGPTVDALVAALVAQKRGSTATPVAVTIDSFSGKQIDLMVPLGVTTAAIAACDGGQYKSWTDSTGGDRYNQGPGQHDLLDVLDVNGQTLEILRAFYPANTAADLAELQAIVDSVKITPPVPTATGAPTPSPSMASTLP